MCNQRERLIGYVYDECDAQERAVVQEHLESCPECRTEIAALRSVRADLQTWDVPDHESVWRPFAPAPAPSWWNLVPRWAFAAAAAVVVASGAAGGALAHAMMPHETAVMAAQTNGGPAVTPVTINDMNMLEARMKTLIRLETDRLSSQVQLVSSRPIPMSPQVEAALHATFDKQLADLRAVSDKQFEAINAIYNNQVQVQKGFDLRHEVLKNRVSSLASVIGQEK